MHGRKSRGGGNVEMRGVRGKVKRHQTLERRDGKEGAQGSHFPPYAYARARVVVLPGGGEIYDSHMNPQNPSLTSHHSQEGGKERF